MALPGGIEVVEATEWHCNKNKAYTTLIYLSFLCFYFFYGRFSSYWRLAKGAGHLLEESYTSS